MKETIRVLLSEEEVDRRIKEVADQIRCTSFPSMPKWMAHSQPARPPPITATSSATRS